MIALDHDEWTAIGVLAAELVAPRRPLLPAASTRCYCPDRAGHIGRKGYVRCVWHRHHQAACEPHEHHDQ